MNTKQMKTTITINIPINPILIHWYALTAYAWNEIIHWGMSASAPMYNGYVIRKSYLKERMK
jgi:hypothetical protein